MPILSLGLSLYKTIKSAGAVALSYVTDSLKLYFNFAKETSEDPAYTGHKEVQFASAGSTSFDGVNDYIDCGTAIGTSFGASVSEITVSAWVNTDVAGNDSGIFGFGTFSNNSVMSLTLNTSTQLRFYTAVGYQTYASTLTAGRWYHVACTYDAGLS